MSNQPILVTGAAGFIGFYVARQLIAEGHAVVGLDNLNAYYDPALKRARREAGRRGVQDAIEFVEADVTALQFGDASFDLCVTYNGLHCLPNPRAALGELARVLRPGGTLRGTSCVTGRGPRQDALIAMSRRAGVFGNPPPTGQIEKWLTEFGLDVVTLERSGAVEFFEARLPFRKQAD